MEQTDVEPETTAPKGLQAIELTLSLPIDDDEIASLRVGDWVLVSGTMYLIGERAGQMLLEEWDEGAEESFSDETGSVLFAETSHAPLGKVIGSIEPGSVRQQAMLCCALLDTGIRCIIGSGALNEEALDRLKKKRGLYLATVSGAGALLARTVHQAEVVACEGLGHGAVRRIKVTKLPCVVALDGFGRYLL